MRYSWIAADCNHIGAPEHHTWMVHRVADAGKYCYFRLFAWYATFTNHGASFMIKLLNL